MADTYDTDPATLPPLTAAVVNGAATGTNRVGPTASDQMLRALLDAIHSIENRLIAGSL